MGEAFNNLQARLADYTHLQQAASLLNWDQETYMPAGAVQSRGDQMATVSKLAHELFVSAQTRKLLRLAAKDEAVAGHADSDEAAIVRVTQRDFKRETRVPTEFLVELERTRAESHQAWIEARRASNFKHFEPWLTRMFDLARRYTDYMGYKEHPYDALLDIYEPGMRASQVRTVFAELRDGLVPLVKAIGAKAGAIDDAILHVHYPRERQIEFAMRVSQQFGYDLNHGRMDASAHPFCTSFSSRDVRITTRLDENFFNPMLFGTLHETGHAMYEQGISAAFAHTPLEGGASLGIHESQSRMWENLVGRCHEFWEFFYPQLREVFPQQLGQVTMGQFYRAINRVNPSLIRIEADEVTYNLHIMVRFELELEVLEGKLKVADLPAAWNARYQDYLGVTPPDDAHGVLQDTHWSIGSIGYFPTYSLGNLASVQLFEQAQAEVEHLTDSIAAGDFNPLLGWLREHVHQYGRKYTPEQLLKRATGKRLSARPYLRYLHKKYKRIYAL